MKALAILLIACLLLAGCEDLGESVVRGAGYKIGRELVDKGIDSYETFEEKKALGGNQTNATDLS